MTDREFRLPHLRACLKFTGNELGKIFYDVKFYPYAKSEQIFAAVGDREILICRPSTDKLNALEVISTIRDLEQIETPPNEPPPCYLNSCTWAVRNGVPLLCVAGISGLLKVIDVLKASLGQTLVGHGGEINDLCTHPVHPHIVASASADHSVRVWSLLPEHGKNPSLLILGHGQAHREGILSCAFHHSGRYMITGGFDHAICIWTLPDLSMENLRSWVDTKVIHFPHFITQSVHNNYVDCVAFHGDLILSKAAKEDLIALWMVTGFSSKMTPPSQDTAPVTQMSRDTCSGFLKMVKTDSTDDKTAHDDEVIPAFQRLLSFSADNSPSFYMRFSLLRPSPQHPELHPLLAFMNTRTKLMIWDLTRLRLGHEGPFGLEEETKKPNKRSRKKGRVHHQRSMPPPQTPISDMNSSRASPSSSSRGDSITDRSTPFTNDPNISSSFNFSRSSTSAASVKLHGIAPSPAPLPANVRRKYDTSNPFQKIVAHQNTTIPKLSKHMTARQTAWSPDGRWLVVVGQNEEGGLIALYER